jgi:hypothetical protein
MLLRAGFSYTPRCTDGARRAVAISRKGWLKSKTIAFTVSSRASNKDCTPDLADLRVQAPADRLP